ncbi:hypothetical protein BH09MYX1_BH09MYX1_28500 [soil metagenome]
MKRAFFALVATVALASSAVACSSPARSTFGLEVTVKDAVKKGSICDLPRSAQGGSSLKVDSKTAPPNFWVETQHDFDEDAAYTVRAYTADAYQDGTNVPLKKNVLVEKRYDEAFGRTHGTDTLKVTFEGTDYAVVVSGFPDGETCPTL